MSTRDRFELWGARAPNAFNKQAVLVGFPAYRLGGLLETKLGLREPAFRL